MICVRDRLDFVFVGDPGAESADAMTQVGAPCELINMCPRRTDGVESSFLHSSAVLCSVVLVSLPALTYFLRAS